MFTDERHERGHIGEPERISKGPIRFKRGNYDLIKALAICCARGHPGSLDVCLPNPGK